MEVSCYYHPGAYTGGDVTVFYIYYFYGDSLFPLPLNICSGLTLPWPTRAFCHFLHAVERMVRLTAAGSVYTSDINCPRSPSGGTGGDVTSGTPWNAWYAFHGLRHYTCYQQVTLYFLHVGAGRDVTSGTLWDAYMRSTSTGTTFPDSIYHITSLTLEPDVTQLPGHCGTHDMRSTIAGIICFPNQLLFGHDVTSGALWSAWRAFHSTMHHIYHQELGHRVWYSLYRLPHEAIYAWQLELIWSD